MMAFPGAPSQWGGADPSTLGVLGALRPEGAQGRFQGASTSMVWSWEPLCGMGRLLQDPEEYRGTGCPIDSLGPMPRE